MALSNLENDSPQINKGTELMLRREKVTPEKRGAFFNQTITFLGKTFHFKLEFSWDKILKE